MSKVLLKILKQFVLFFLLLSTTVVLYSQENDTISAATVNDTSAVKLRTPSEKQLEALRNNRSYDYERNPPPSENVLAKFWYWFWQKLTSFLRGSSYQNFWQYIILAFLAGLVVWLLYKANFGGGLFGRKAEEDTLSYNRITENIHVLDFNDLIEEALQQNNYRLAVRLYYLKILKQLTDKQLIHWQPTKTNRQYVEELERASLRSDFEHLTSQFEYVWYGEFSVSESTFWLLKEEFHAFLTKI